jgi:hypothetical protein
MKKIDKFSAIVSVDVSKTEVQKRSKFFVRFGPLPVLG